MTEREKQLQVENTQLRQLVEQLRSDLDDANAAGAVLWDRLARVCNCQQAQQADLRIAEMVSRGAN